MKFTPCLLVCIGMFLIIIGLIGIILWQRGLVQLQFLPCPQLAPSPFV